MHGAHDEEVQIGGITYIVVEVDNAAAYPYIARPGGIAYASGIPKIRGWKRKGPSAIVDIPSTSVVVPTPQRKMKAPTTNTRKKKASGTRLEVGGALPHDFEGCIIQALVVILPAGWVRKRRVTKKTSGLTIKIGCQCFFVAKQLYVDTFLCELHYHC